MRKALTLFLAAVFSISILSGCAKEIDYSDIPDEDTTETPAETLAPIEHPTFTENRTIDYGISLYPFSEKVQAEDLKQDTEKKVDELEGFSGEGYVKLEKDQILSLNMENVSNQHYNIGIQLYGNGAIVGLYIGEVEHGGYYALDNNKFGLYTLSPVYIRGGDNTLNFQVLSGTAYIDFLTVESSAVADVGKYQVEPQLINFSANEKTQITYEYLIDIYGKNTLTGQHNTINTNIETEAIYEATGRYPAIRIGDLKNYSRCFGGSEKEKNCELELSEEWSAYGGIVMLDWTWYSPTTSGTSHFYTANTDFKIDNVVCERDITTESLEYIEALADNGTIPTETYELIRDIDDMATNLIYLRDRGVSVLWRPMKEPNLGWYWWGAGSPNSYIYVWRLMVDRFHRYHGLDNLIWVWSGQSSLYYPGDNYVDIIAEDCYNLTDSSNAPRFENARTYTPTTKMIALSECGLSPNPDVLKRDNSLWLFFGLFKGDYLVGDNGLHASAYNLKERLSYIYSHELTITLDELIPFSY